MFLYIFIMIEKKYELCADLLEDVRLHIDFESMNKGRLRWIRDEFANKAKAHSRCYSSLWQFLDRMCRSFNSRLAMKRTTEIISAEDNNELMNVFRTESQIPVLVLQLRRDEKKKQFNS